MRKSNKIVIQFLSVLCFFAFSVASIVAQTDDGPVKLFQGNGNNGPSQPIPVGSFKVSGKSLGASAFSIFVTRGYKVRFCEDPAAAGEAPKCEEYGEGAHDLKSVAFTAIRVWKDDGTAAPTATPAPAPVPTTVATPTATSAPTVATKPPPRDPPVIVYEAMNWGGRSQVYVPGMYRADRAEFGHINDNQAMSTVVAKGFRVRFCSDVGVYSRGTGDCELHDEGRYNLRFANSISFIEVIDLSDKRPDDDTMPVVLYEDTSQAGKKQGFDIGISTASANQFDKIGNDKASSVTVKDGYKALICSDEIADGASTDKCEEVGPGKHNLRQKRVASYIKVWKADK